MRGRTGRLWIVVGAWAIAWALSACRPIPAGGTEPFSPASTTAQPRVTPAITVSSPAPTPSPRPSATPTQEEWSIVPAEARPTVDRARSDLASRLQIGEEQVRMVSIETVDWRDSSLGCPQPGRSYLQVITPGYRIVLRVAGSTYEYHAAQGQDRVILCQEGAPVK